MAFVTINKTNFEHNIKTLTQKTGDVSKIMAVLKNNAYGHGLEIMAKLSCELGIKRAAVKNLKEAEKIVHLFDEVLVLVDHPPTYKISSKISIAVNSLKALQQIMPETSVHLNLDTGMHRNGLVEDEYLLALEIIQQKKLFLKGVFTHFRSADKLDSDYFWQESNYQRAKVKILSHLNALGIQTPLFHSCNSAALLRQNGSFSDDYARCGIAMYGYSYLPKTYVDCEFKPVMSLWAKKLSTRVLKKGQKIGYGGVYKCMEDEIVSTYDIGYGDGFFRYDGFGELYTADKESIVGRVSMDSLFVKSDKELVCLFNDATMFAKHFNTITYEIVTKISPEIERKII
jgi:alanine racemase